MSSKRYHQAYSNLGDERVQVITKEPVVDRRTVAEIRRGVKLVDTYWDTRVDDSWSKIPGYFVKNKRTKTRKFYSHIPRILIKLHPANTFNPIDKWEDYLTKLEEESNPTSTNNNSSNNSKQLTKKDKIIQDNIIQMANKKFTAEVTRIRNSKKTLLEILKEIKIFDARIILMVEILKQAYDEYKAKKTSQEKKLLYETLWAIDTAVNFKKGEVLPKFDPKLLKPVNEQSVLVKDSGLVYDDYKDVEKLLKDARKVMSQETDMIKLQLVDMSDSLPPLSKFTFGHKLDPWQIRVLSWIDAGKSVVICAPTSSGKTILSSYVAFIFKATASKAEKEEAMLETKKKNTASTAAALTLKAGADEEEVDGDGDEEADDDGDDYMEEVDDEEEEVDVDEVDIAQVEQLNLNEHEEVGADGDVSKNLVQSDRLKRKTFSKIAALDKTISGESGQRILFVVPTEPLVWQVAANFDKLLRSTDKDSAEHKVAIVTDHLTYYPPTKFNVMPSIVVGTPLALENALTKPRGLVGSWETKKRAQGDLLPGGFDHFDWVVYDEVHALDGQEGSALQRLIRSMNCKFLALSATVGNADELRGWMERVKGDYFLGLESITVDESEVGAHAGVAGAKSPKTAEQSEATNVVDNLLRVKIVKTITNESKTIYNIDGNTTLAALKEKIVQIWPELVDSESQLKMHTKNAFQLIWKDKDLNNEQALLSSYGLFNSNDTEVKEEVLHLRSFVNMLTHQGRFINLQRYIWSGGSKDSASSSSQQPLLQTASPLLAVESVKSLQDGVLNNSSLSFTSRDSYELWDKIKKIFPVNDKTADPILKAMNPNVFFATKERITLQDTKDYEDLLKSGLQGLAEKYPVETRELLYSFQISDPIKEFDLCEIVLELKHRDMIPCLPFHLNTFEAIRLFQQLLAGIEYRQKIAFPTYYTDQMKDIEERKKEVAAKIKNSGKDDKAVEDLAKSGEIDLNESFEIDQYAPHPKFTFSKGNTLSQIELDELVDEMEQNDGFEKRDKDAMIKFKGKNKTILEHALIRGLRRGIGLFIDEVSFSSYRRAVQRLASAGKLAVVISDDSLAFGVNMPFRTCIFCGEMFGELDELMAQQMSGRAGRRGLDTQGNLVYAGMRISRIRRLMIGKVANITGVNHNPRYESMFLQPILSPRHVGFNRAEVIGGRTLNEHVKKAQLNDFHYTMQQSKDMMLKLDFISYDESSKTFIPNKQSGHTYASLSVIWQMRDTIHESISLGLLFPDIMDALNLQVGTMSLNEKKQNADKIEQLVLRFFVIITLLIGRNSYDEVAKSFQVSSSSLSSEATTGTADPSIDENTILSGGVLKLEDLPFFTHYPLNKEYLQDWNNKFRHIQSKLIEDVEYPELCDPIGPDVALDGTLFHCIYDRRYVHTLTDEHKQHVKARLWHLGNVLKNMKNCSWPEEKYTRVAYFLFRTAFEKVKFLIGELIRGKIDFIDISSADREKRTDIAGAVEIPPEAGLWSDNNLEEPSSVFPNSYCSAVERCLERCKQEPGLDKRVLVYAFKALTTSDASLIDILSEFNLKDATHLVKVSEAVANSSFANKSSVRMIGLLSWIVIKIYPSAMPKFPMYLKTLYDKEIISGDDVKNWHKTSFVELLSHIPSTYINHFINAQNMIAIEANVIKEADVVNLKKSADIFINFLEAPADDDDDEEEDDDDEEEED